MTDKEILAELKRSYEYLIDIRENGSIDHCSGQMKDNLDKLNEAHNLAQKAYDVSANRFAAGQTSAIELSDVSGALYQMDMAVLNAKYNILMAAESVKKLGE